LISRPDDDSPAAQAEMFRNAESDSFVGSRDECSLFFHFLTFRNLFDKRPRKYTFIGFPEDFGNYRKPYSSRFQR
jgi:hypothetical protein